MIPLCIALIVIGLLLGMLSIITKPTPRDPATQVTRDVGESAFTGNSASAVLGDKENASIIEHLYGSADQDRQHSGKD